MGKCNCGAGRKTATSKPWVHTDKTGKKTTYDREASARMAAARQGGTVTQSR